MSATWKARYQALASRARAAAEVARQNAADLDAHREAAVAAHAAEVAALDEADAIYPALREAADNRLAYETGPLGRDRLFQSRVICAKPEYHEALAGLADRAAGGEGVTTEDWRAAIDAAGAYPDPMALAQALGERDAACLTASEAIYGEAYGGAGF